MKVSYLRPQVWEILPNSYKNVDGLDKFKNAIKKWEPCRICNFIKKGDSGTGVFL